MPAAPKLLTIDTSTTACSVALSDGSKILGEYLLDTDRTLSGQILSALDSILGDAGLSIQGVDGIGVALGPGSFTGLRIGVATAKGLALAASKPVFGFSSLAMLAFNLPWSAYPVCPMIDARKSEVYAAVYDCTSLPEAIVEDCVLSPASFLGKITETAVFVGSGALRYREMIQTVLGERAIFAPFPCHQPRASAGAALAHHAFEQGNAIPLHLLNPSYIRPSEAELQKMKK